MTEMLPRMIHSHYQNREQAQKQENRLISPFENPTSAQELYIKILFKGGWAMLAHKALGSIP